MGQNLQFLLNPNIVFISSSLSSKSNTCNDLNNNFHAQAKGKSRYSRLMANPRKHLNNLSANYLVILLNALRRDGLGDHDHVPLNLEADQDLEGGGSKGINT